MTLALTTILQSALAYAEKGWPVFPCHPKSKIPATEHGFKDASTDPAVIRYWWEENPDYNVAIATGECSGLYVADFDDKPGRTVQEAIASLGIEWPETPTVRTGGHGVQFFYAYPKGSGLSITGGKLGLGIDTRGNGGYVVAPPSIHPNGNAYKWMDFEDAPLVPTPEIIVTRLQVQQTKSVLASAEKLTGGRHHTLMTAAALMRGNGFVPRETFAALAEMRARLDLSDGRVVTDDEIRRIAEWTADKSMGLVNIHSVVHGDEIAKSLAAKMGEAIAEVADAKEPIENPGPFPQHLLTMPGMIGELLAYMDATAFKRQPILALGAALTAAGVLMGRKVETENGGRTNLYCIGIAKSGAGKENARQAIKEVFALAGADGLIGPEDLASESGMVAVLIPQPSVLFMLDEMGRLLRVLNDPKASPHLLGIISAWLKLYSSARSVYKGKAYADPERNPVISQPNACIYGTTVPESMWASLSSESITDGLLARCLLFQSEDHNPPKNKRARIKPPASLIEAVRWWYVHGYQLGQPGGVGNLADKMTPIPFVVERNADAEAVFLKLDALAQSEMEKLAGHPLEALWTRVEQKADQLALIFACSRDRQKPVVDEQAARWGADLATYLTRRLIYDCYRHVSENETEATSKRVLRIIEDAGAAGITQNELTGKTQWVRGRRREREEILAQLIEMNRVMALDVEGRGRPARVYKSTKYREIKR